MEDTEKLIESMLQFLASSSDEDDDSSETCDYEHETSSSSGSFLSFPRTNEIFRSEITSPNARDQEQRYTSDSDSDGETVFHSEYDEYAKSKVADTESLDSELSFTSIEPFSLYNFLAPYINSKESITQEQLNNVTTYIRENLAKIRRDYPLLEPSEYIPISKNVGENTTNGPYDGSVQNTSFRFHEKHPKQSHSFSDEVRLGIYDTEDNLIPHDCEDYYKAAEDYALLGSQFSIVPSNETSPPNHHENSSKFLGNHLINSSAAVNWQTSPTLQTLSDDTDQIYSSLPALKATASPFYPRPVPTRFSAQSYNYNNPPSNQNPTVQKQETWVNPPNIQPSSETFFYQQNTAQEYTCASYQTQNGPCMPPKHNIYYGPQQGHPVVPVATCLQSNTSQYNFNQYHMRRVQAPMTVAYTSYCQQTTRFQTYHNQYVYQPLIMQQPPYPGSQYRKEPVCYLPFNHYGLFYNPYFGPTGPRLTYQCQNPNPTPFTETRFENSSRYDQFNYTRHYASYNENTTQLSESSITITNQNVETNMQCTTSLYKL